MSGRRHIKIIAFRFRMSWSMQSMERSMELELWYDTTIDGQTNPVKKNRISLSVVNPSSVAGSEQDHYDYESLSQSTTDGQFVDIIMY